MATIGPTIISRGLCHLLKASWRCALSPLLGSEDAARRRKTSVRNPRLIGLHWVETRRKSLAVSSFFGYRHLSCYKDHLQIYNSSWPLGNFPPRRPVFDTSSSSFRAHTRTHTVTTHTTRGSFLSKGITTVSSKTMARASHLSISLKVWTGNHDV